MSFGDEAPDVYAGAKAKGWKQLWLRHQLSLLSGAALLVLALGAYHLFSDGDFSFLMTLGSLLVLFAFGLLVLKVALTRKVRNLSLKTLQCYALVFAARLCSILRYEGYLPYDRSGDWFYKATEVCALALVVGLIACTLGPFRTSYQAQAAADNKLTLPGLPSWAGALVLAVPALLVAGLLHPNLNGNFLTDTAWAFALYLESVAILPQIMLFQGGGSAGGGAGGGGRSGGGGGGGVEEIEPLEANFVFCLAVARAMHLVFWASSFHELNDKGPDAAVHRRFPGHFVVIAQALNLIVMADFVWFYIVAARAKKGVILPVSLQV